MDERACGWLTHGVWALAALLVPAASVGQAESCLATASTTSRASAAQTEYAYTSAGHAVDARGIGFRHLTDHAIRLEGSQAACFAGGSVDGPYPEDAIYECKPKHCPKAGCPSPCLPFHETAGIAPAVAAPTVIEDVRIGHYGDGVSQESRANRAPFEVRRAWLHDIHDDAVESDFGASVTVTDTLIERAFIAFASRFRSKTPLDARDRTFEVRGSLVMAHRFTNAYKQKAGHGGFWKWPGDGTGPKLVVTDNVFVADDLGSGQLLFPLVDQLEECRNNRLLWAGSPAAWRSALATGDGSDGLDNGGRLDALSHCYTVVVKRAGESKVAFLAEHWDPLVRAWKANHAAAGAAPGPAGPEAGGLRPARRTMPATAGR